MAITIKDASNVDIDYVRTSFQLQDAVNQRGLMSFDHIGPTKPIDWGQEIYVYDGATKIWGGTVESYVETDITVGDLTTLRWTFRCVDFSQFMSRSLLAESYTNTTAGAIVTSLASAFYPADFGVTAGTIEDGANIEAITFNYLPLEIVLDELAELSGFYWNVDKDKQLNFQPIDGVAAAFSITDSSRPYRQIRFQESRGQFVNQVFVRAGTRVDEDSTVEVQKGDGEKRAFLVGAPIGDVPTVEVDTGSGYSTKTVGVNGIGTDSEFYYVTGTPVITQDPDETPLSATDKIKITYKGRYPLIVSATQDESVVERNAAEGNLGVYQKVIDALDVETQEEAQLRAQAVLQQYSRARLTCSYTTDTSGLEAGQAQTINLTEHGINAVFLLEKVSASMLDDGTLRYSVEGAATQTVAGWSYWKQKTRQDRKFVVRDNEVLNNLLRESEDLTLSDLVTGTTYAGAYTVNGADTYINGFHVG
jgi:hypothetical protein